MGNTQSASANVAQVFQAERLKFPALLPEETIVMRAWLTLHETGYDRFDYNVLLGPDQDPGPAYSQVVRDDWIRLRKLRVDAVGWNGVDSTKLPAVVTDPAQVYAVFPGAAATIIEVKRNAGATNIGQLTTYFNAWLNQFPQSIRPRLILAAAMYSPNIVPALQNVGIHLDVVQADFSSLKLPKFGASTTGA